MVGAGHVAGQNIDVRLTAEDGYQAERSYAIAWASESAKVALTVEPAPARRPRIFVCGPTAIVHESKRIRVEEFGPMGG